MTESGSVSVPTLRVLHILGSLDHGGAELRALEQMGELAGRGVRADFLCLAGKPGALADKPLAWGGRVIPHRLSPSFPYWFWRFLRRERYDVVHSHIATASGLPLSVARLAGVPRRVAQFHSDGDGHVMSAARRTQQEVMRRALRWAATALVGVSPESLKFGVGAAAVEDPRAMILTNGVTRSTLDVTPKKDRAVRLVNVGRPLPTKRRDFLLPILQAVREMGTDAELVIVGKGGEDTDSIDTQARAAGLTGQVTMMGIRDDVRAVLNDCDLLVFPSAREGLPVVLLEALFEGTPVVASDLPGMRFIVDTVPGVPLTTVAVDASAEEWAQACVDTLSAAPPREAIRELMEASAFTMERSLAVLGAAYGLDDAAGPC